MEERVILVDQEDRPLGEAEKMMAHQQALLHRAVSVFIFNSERKMLLQKRALGKYHSPGLWTNAACTHPQPGEETIAAARRRLKEEMNLWVEDLTPLFHFIYHDVLDDHLSEHELDYVFVGFSDVSPTPNPEEVADYHYMDVGELLRSVDAEPQKYTVWFKRIVERVIHEVDLITS